MKSIKLRRSETAGRQSTGGACWRLASAAAILASLFATTGNATDTPRSAVSRGDIAAKISYCQDCHGPQGRGYVGFYPMPRLAGQQPEYLENQLRAFIEHRRTNNIMANVAHVLTPAMVSAIAEDFRNFDPPPLGGAPKRLIAQGKAIFEDGLPDANIAACAACHGPNASGNGQIPRLAGQLYPYVIMALRNWGKERGQKPSQPDMSAVMSPVAHSLSGPQMEAVAAFVSSLK